MQSNRAINNANTTMINSKLNEIYGKPIQILTDYKKNYRTYHRME